LTSGTTLVSRNEKTPGGHAKLRDISVTVNCKSLLVEKKQDSFRPAVKTGCFIIALLLADTVIAQKMHTIKGYCGIYYKSMDDLRRQKQPELDFYDFRPGQFVASIGAQCSHWEAVYAAASDSVRFYLEDIDTTYFNQRQTGFAWHYYDSLRGSPMTCTYDMVIGTERSTHLPENIFDKVIIINSFHEFSNPGEMLDDISTKLKAGGILYIDESVPKKPGQLHGVCKKRMFTPEELTALLSRYGYEQQNSVDLQFRKGKTYRKIYAFKRISSL